MDHKLIFEIEICKVKKKAHTHRQTNKQTKSEKINKSINQSFKNIYAIIITNISIALFQFIT